MRKQIPPKTIDTIIVIARSKSDPSMIISFESPITFDEKISTASLTPKPPGVKLITFAIPEIAPYNSELIRWKSAFNP